MKYFKKFLNFWKPYTLGFIKELLLVGLFALFWVSFCIADNPDAQAFTVPLQSSYYTVDTWFCYYRYASSWWYFTVKYSDNTEVIANWTMKMYCVPSWVQIKWNTNWWNATVYNVLGLTWFIPTCDYSDYITQAQCNAQYSWYIPESECQQCIPCDECPIESMTSLQCQTQYNLIPVSSVTENYCTANFDLINPSQCPISEWTGWTSRSALYLNNVQYAGASNIYVNFNDYLDWSTTYIDSWSSFVLDIDGYVADTWYMADILAVQQYHPDNEDFQLAFIGGLTLILPYVVIVLFVVFVRKLIRKIFKS